MAIDWVKIVAFIVAEIAKGVLESAAVSKAATKFGVSEADIRSHGGF